MHSEFKKKSSLQVILLFFSPIWNHYSYISLNLENGHFELYFKKQKQKTGECGKDFIFSAHAWLTESEF